jgi:hypothetical protein
MQARARLVSTRKMTDDTPIKAKRTPRPAQRPGSYSQEVHDTKGPQLSPCILRGPDGQERSGWEMRVGEVLFGRADSKESLLQYYARIHEPMPSGHWRDRSWQTTSRGARRSRSEHDDHYYEEEEVGLGNDYEFSGGWD